MGVPGHSFVNHSTKPTNMKMAIRYRRKRFDELAHFFFLIAHTKSITSSFRILGLQNMLILAVNHTPPMFGSNV